LASAHSNNGAFGESDAYFDMASMSAVHDGACAPLQAQNEAMLRQAFEGKVVAVKIDMPATQQGVDVYPLGSDPVDFREVAQRLKDNSTALRIGQQVMVTKVVVKKNSHIEFQLVAVATGHSATTRRRT
jgi:hypothetical protein